MRDANRAAGVTMDRYDYMRRAQAGAQPGDHWLLPNQQAPMLTAPGSAPSVSGNAYDMRPENLAETMRRPPPATVESFAVRQYPAARQTSDPAQPFRVSMPLGVSVARDPLAVWRGRQIQRHAAIRLGGLAVRRRAHRPARAWQRPAGLCAGRSRRHGLRGAQSGRQDPGTVSTATRLLRELGYKSEVVSHL